MYTNFSSKKIAIFGLGVSGRAALRFCQLMEADVVVVGSGDPATWDFGNLKKVKCLDQDDPTTADILSSMNSIILSPGIPREHSCLQKALGKKVPVVNEVELAFDHFPGKIVAVTGTNGKTTTASVLGQLLTQLGQSVFVGGNYGVPFLEWVCDFLEDKNVPMDFAVIELSSFQLESLNHFRADLGILLNISPSHSERYQNFENYKQAKMKMVKVVDKLLHSGQSKYGEQLPDKKLRDEYLLAHFNLDHFPLEGDYNRDNLWFIAKALEYFGFDLSPLELGKIIGEPYRLQKIAEGIFNDAKSTNWQATISAVEALHGNTDICLIAGGKKRSNLDNPDSSQQAHLKNLVKEFYFFGESGLELQNLFQGKYFKTLDEVVKNLDLKKTILFSPAYPSFDQFKNYVERGKYFNDLISARQSGL